MNNTTLTALKNSITHWERICDPVTTMEEEIGVRSCALCQLFWRNNCNGCPVTIASGNILCQDTPYYEVQKAYKESGKGSPEYLAAAKKELEFLLSLLPTDDSKS